MAYNNYSNLGTGSGREGEKRREEKREGRREEER